MAVVLGREGLRSVALYSHFNPIVIILERPADKAIRQAQPALPAPKPAIS
jgi:hypothetical protein